MGYGGKILPLVEFSCVVPWQSFRSPYTMTSTATAETAISITTRGKDLFCSIHIVIAHLQCVVRWQSILHSFSLFLQALLLYLCCTVHALSCVFPYWVRTPCPWCFEQPLVWFLGSQLRTCLLFWFWTL